MQKSRERTGKPENNNRKRIRKGKEELSLEDLEEEKELYTTPVTEEDKEEFRISQRRIQSKGQQCVDEYMQFILNGEASSIDSRFVLSFFIHQVASFGPRPY